MRTDGYALLDMGVFADYAAMDRLMKDERNYILGIVKKIKASGCNVSLHVSTSAIAFRDLSCEPTIHCPLIKLRHATASIMLYIVNIGA